AEIFQKDWRGAVGHGPADDFRAAHLFHQATLQERLHDAIDGDAADLLDLGAGDRLPIRNDGQRFQGRLRESWWTRLMADEGLEPGRVFRLADELPGTGHAHQPVAA